MNACRNLVGKTVETLQLKDRENGGIILKRTLGNSASYYVKWVQEAKDRILLWY
jgi:hypothetical protein